MKNAVEMASDGMLDQYVPSFMRISLGIQITLTLLLQQFERLQC
jgi:hypothetical protein